MEKCVVILSGGPDSVTVMYWAKNEGYDVHALTFDYNQKGKKEIGIAKELAKAIDAKHLILNLENLSSIYTGVTSLVDGNMEITCEFSVPIIVPFRNGIFMAISVAYAAGIGACQIFYGAHASDEPFYPDCRKGFYQAFEKAAQLGTEKPIIILSPFSETPKSGILKKGLELGVPLEKTWSCYLSKDYHCGKCESCMNRKKAFKDAGLEDKTVYLG